MGRSVFDHDTEFGSRRNKRSPLQEFRQQMKEFGEVLLPDEAEAPILAPATRGALFEWLAELQMADELKAAKLKPRTTALMHGPPGCGKTTLAHHLAARLGIPMLSVGAEGIMAPMLGESEDKLNRLFRTLAETEMQCLIFLDEIEAIGGHRSRNNGGGADNARSSILTVLLRKIETFDGMLMAATNRPDHLDPALWRRFHLQLEVALPGDDERFAILSRYAEPFKWCDEDLDVLCDLLAGASPALLRGVMEGVKRALVLAARMNRQGEDVVTVFRRIVSSVRPPPEIMETAPPPLWGDDPAIWGDISSMQWPPVRGDV